MDECLSRLSAASFVSILSVLYLSTVCGRNSPGEGVHSMNVEELKMRLRALLHQRDMLSYERDSMELDDLLQEIDAEIQELHQKIWKTA